MELVFAAVLDPLVAVTVGIFVDSVEVGDVVEAGLEVEVVVWTLAGVPPDEQKPLYHVCRDCKSLGFVHAESHGPLGVECKELIRLD